MEKPIKGYEGVYVITSTGKVFSYARGRRRQIFGRVNKGN